MPSADNRVGVVQDLFRGKYENDTNSDFINSATTKELIKVLLKNNKVYCKMKLDT